MKQVIGLKSLTLLMVLTYILGGCSGSKNSQGWKILRDKSFFEEELLTVAEKVEETNIKELKEKFNSKTLFAGTDINVSTSKTISIPAEYQPKMNDIIKKYGTPTKTEEGIQYFENVGFGTSGEGGEMKVVSVIIVTTIHAKGSSK